MLEAIGVDSVDDLFADIPAALRANGLNLPPPESEAELADRLCDMAERNRVDLAIDADSPFQLQRQFDRTASLGLAGPGNSREKAQPCKGVRFDRWHEC